MRLGGDQEIATEAMCMPKGGQDLKRKHCAYGVGECEHVMVAGTEPVRGASSSSRGMCVMTMMQQRHGRVLQRTVCKARQRVRHMSMQDIQTHTYIPARARAHTPAARPSSRKKSSSRPNEGSKTAPHWLHSLQVASGTQLLRCCCAMLDECTHVCLRQALMQLGTWRWHIAQRESRCGSMQSAGGLCNQGRAATGS